MSSPHSSINLNAVPDLAFSTPRFRFTFDEYLLHFYGFEVYEVESVEYYQKQYKSIIFS